MLQDVIGGITTQFQSSCLNDDVDFMVAALNLNVKHYVMSINIIGDPGHHHHQLHHFKGSCADGDKMCWQDKGQGGSGAEACGISVSNSIDSSLFVPESTNFVHKRG
mmetsp:Transcript_22422/g.33567  ORF Transcript_22422/g.33567 Transcript_22422/m.33567 type:complete len:107 (-) Transcript_22422:8-328(-)